MSLKKDIEAIQHGFYWKYGFAPCKKDIVIESVAEDVGTFAPKVYRIFSVKVGVHFYTARQVGTETPSIEHIRFFARGLKS